MKQNINESSLSRIWRHNLDHDCGAITAFRSGENCGEGIQYSKRDNLKRNKVLLAKLMSKGYSVTKLIGVYPEGGIQSTENSFFIVDIKDSGKLLEDLKRLGEEFEQDSILFVPRNSVSGENKAFLIGTNHCSNNFLGYGKKLPFNKGKLGFDSPIYTSYVNGRPFMFESVEGKVSNPGSGQGWWALNLIAESDWRDVSLNESEEILAQKPYKSIFE